MPASPTTISPRKRRLFAAAALLLPVLAIVVVELTLRLCGFGGYPATVRKLGPLPGNTQGQTLYITDNEGPRSYFFANRDRPGSVDNHAFIMPKPAGTLRVFTLGESAMKGFPQPQALSSARFLGAMLSDLLPDRHVEVINLGCTAIASFPVLGILSETLNYSPDLIIVYVGNNEFFGAYGVASLHKAGNSPGVIAFQRWYRSTAIGQGIDTLLTRLRGTPKSNEGETLMETMMGRSYTGPDDPLRAQAASNLNFFTTQMIRRCKAKGVPIILCTLPCNERDLAPLGAFDDSRLSAEQRTALKTTLAAAASNLETNPAASVEPLREFTKSQPTHATAHFLLGKALEATGNFKDAAAEFQRAVDLDPMPWRPPSASVLALRDAAATEGALLCDLQQAFRDASRAFEKIPDGTPGGSIGWELMDDHVHPTLRGQDLVARTIIGTLSNAPGPLNIPASKAASLATFDDYAQRLGANDYETWAVAHQVRVLAKIPFFQETNPGMFKRFDDVCRSLEANWGPKLREQALAWEKRETHQGAKRPLSAMVGKVILAEGRIGEAQKLYDTAADCVFDYSSWNLEYTLYSLGCRQQINKGVLSPTDIARAHAAIDRGKMLVSATGGESGITERHIGMLYQLLDDLDSSIPFLVNARRKLYEDNKVTCDVALVQAYLKTGRSAEARAIIEDGMKNAGKFAPAYQKMLPAVEGR